MNPKAKAIPIPRNRINTASLFWISISTLLCLIISSCALPNKFTGLVQPPKDNALIYLYTSSVNKSYNLDDTVVNYSLNQLDKRRLPAGASHAQSVPAGKITIRNHSKTKTRALSVFAEKNETLFIYFKPIINNKSGSSIKFGHAISIHRNTEKTKNQAVELLSKTRVYYFNNKGEELPFDQADSKDSQSTAKAPINQSDKAAKAGKEKALDKSANKAITSAAIAASNTIEIPAAKVTQPISDTPNTPSIPAALTPTKSTADKSATTKLINDQKSLTSIEASGKTVANNKTEKNVETIRNEAEKSIADSAENIPTAMNNIAASWPDFKASAERNTISRFKVSCKKPFRLTQGCSALSITNTVFRINGHKLKMAASADGKIIYIEPAQTIGNATKQIFTLTFAADKQKMALSEGIKAVKQLLAENDINTLETYEVIERKRRSGWIFSTDADSYQLLRAEDKRNK